jgi:hypothetical protein
VHDTEIRIFVLDRVSAIVSPDRAVGGKSMSVV